MAYLELKDVALKYPGADGVQALQNVSFDMEKGGFVSVVGPSGCGKSSLMKLLSGLLAPTGGDVHLAKRALSGPTDRVGMAFQNPTLLPWRRSLDNVLLPLEVVDRYRADMRSAAGKARHRERAQALLETVGLGDSGSLYPWQLSGGMQQRVSLCRALIHEPELLILDEPFGALDAFTREELWGVLRDLWRERGFTCLLVTHDLREAALLADQIVVLSARPATVQKIARPPFPQPRTVDHLYEAEMIHFIKELRSEIGRAMGRETKPLDISYPNAPEPAFAPRFDASMGTAGERP